MPTLQYRISERVYNGRAEVMARFYSGKSFSQRAKTHIFAVADAWDNANGCVIVPKRAVPEADVLRTTQRQLDALRDAIYAVWWKEQYTAGEGWLQSTIDDYLAIPREFIRKQLPEVVRECADSKQLESRSRDQYEVLAVALERYAAKHKPFYIDDFRQKDVEDFVQFYRKENISTKNGKTKTIVRSRNTIVSKLKKLSSVCNYAVARGYMEDTPFGNGKYHIPLEVYGDPVFLTIQERNALYNFADLPENLATQRDIFIFQCHVGCRVSDLISFTPENITEDGFLQYIPHKTRKDIPVVIRVPLSDTALAIIDKYKGLPSGKLLPFEHPNTYNEDIHYILRLAGLNRIVMVQDPKTLEPIAKELWQVASSHISRRTFMANVFKETKSERITSAFTGHVDGSRAFKRYTLVDDEMKLSVLRDMKEKN